MADHQPRAAWEYLTIPEAERGQLTELGRDGWELVAAGGVEAVLYLKRPAQDFRERVTLEQREAYYRARGITRSPIEQGHKK